MKLNNTVVSLALLGVLALAGGLLPAGKVIYAQNDAPEFTEGATTTRSVDENTPAGTNIGAPVSATDADEVEEEFGDSLIYSLEGTDEASFDIEPSTGQLITKDPLDNEADAQHRVTVRVKDSSGDDDTIDVTINVTDVNELPAAPPPPTVVSGPDTSGTDEDESTTSLKVVWHPIVNTGREDVSSYAVQYKKTTETTFGDANVDHSGAATTATITGLDPDTSYQVRVRARNIDVTSNDGPWSFVGTGSTNKANNSSPKFAQSVPHPLIMAENSPSGQSVGAPVTADDADSRTLSYRFKGRDADLFDFNSSNGQIRTKRGVTYDHEDPACGYPTECTYYVTVVASDGAGGTDALRVEISVTNRTEIPSTPAQPTVRPTANSLTSLDVSWSEPVNTGPAITTYTVEYRGKGSTDDFSSGGIPDSVTGTSTTISGTDSTNNDAPWLDPGKSYEVRVRATSDEGTGGWSPLGTGSTNVGNREPVFRDRNLDATPVGTAATTARELNENTQPGRPVGRPVVADDGDGDARSYKLVAVTPDDDASETAAAKFDINKSTGQILTKAPLNHEDEDCGYVEANDTPTSTIATTCTYTVVVEVSDGLDENRTKEDETTADDTITVTITVKDVTEKPSVPTVILTSPEDVTKLDVKWYLTNTGPPTTTVDLQYREGSGLLVSR